MDLIGIEFSNHEDAQHYCKNAPAGKFWYPTRIGPDKWGIRTAEFAQGGSLDSTNNGSGMIPKYTTKDSGARETFTSGMQRDTQDGKTRWDLVFDGPLLERYAALLTRGAQKYEARNWMKAAGQAELDRFKASAARHFAQWMAGAYDEDHAAAVVFNINGALYVAEKMRQDAADVCDVVKPDHRTMGWS